jgi:enoyl-CoA hydratase/carnithine racemase
MSLSTGVHYSVEGRAGLLMIAHPPANTLSLSTIAALQQAIQEARGDARAKVLVISGEGKLFSAGADIHELAALSDCAAAQSFARAGQAVCQLIEGGPKPVIAALNGRGAFGGGVELALACHLRMIELSAQLASPEIKLGLTVGWGGSQRLPRLIGQGRALEMLLSGRPVTAPEALQMGLVNRVVPDGAVLQEALAWAQEIACLSAPALAATVGAVHAGLYHGLEPGLRAEIDFFSHLCENQDWHEGTAAFLEKRKPGFCDR